MDLTSLLASLMAGIALVIGANYLWRHVIRPNRWLIMGGCVVGVVLLLGSRHPNQTGAFMGSVFPSHLQHSVVGIGWTLEQLFWTFVLTVVGWRLLTRGGRKGGKKK